MNLTLTHRRVKRGYYGYSKIIRVKISIWKIMVQTVVSDEDETNRDYLCNSIPPSIS
jgi:hypothetical protein